MSNETSVLSDIVASTHVVGVVGERGTGKSWLLTLLSEIAAMGDWHNIVWDTKGDDVLRDIAAQGWQARVLKAAGLEPRGWKTKYYTFKFPYGLTNVPFKFNLAPIALKMIGFGHLELLGSVLSASEQRLLVDAYFDAGGRDAKIEDVIKRILVKKKKEKLSRTLLALVTCGFFDNTSPLEADNLLNEAENYDYTIVNTSFFEASSIGLARFGLLVLLDNIKHYLRSMQTSHMVIFTFRELGEIAGRVGMVGTGWHLAQHVVDFVRTARQTGLSVTKVFYEAQSVRDVPPPLLENTHVVFVHPTNMKQEKQLKEIKKYWPLSEDLLRSVAAIENDRPGFFYVLRKDGSWDLLNAPPPLSMMIREYLSKEEAEKEREMLDNLLPKMNIAELEREAITRMKFWLLQKIDKEETDIGFFDFEKFSRTFRMTRTVAYILAGIRYNMPPNGGTFMITRHDISAWVYKQWRMIHPTGLALPSRWTTYRNVLASLGKRKKAFEEIGIRYAVSQDKKIIFIVDSERFMKAWEYYKNDVLSLLHFKVTENLEPQGVPIQNLTELNKKDIDAELENVVAGGLELAEQRSG